jgi:hypothetical protein
LPYYGNYHYLKGCSEHSRYYKDCENCIKCLPESYRLLRRERESRQTQRLEEIQRHIRAKYDHEIYELERRRGEEEYRIQHLRRNILRREQQREYEHARMLQLQEYRRTRREHLKLLCDD